MTSARYHFIKDSVCVADFARSTERGWNKVITRTDLTLEEKEVIEACLSLPLHTPWPSFNYPTVRSLIKNYRIIYSAYDGETEALAKKLQNKTIKISLGKILDALNLALKDIKDEEPFANAEATNLIFTLLYYHLSHYGVSSDAELANEVSASALLQGRKEFDDRINSRTFGTTDISRISNRAEQGTVLIVRPKIVKAINDMIAAHTTNEEIIQSLNRQSKLCMAMDNVWGNFLRRHYREADSLLEKQLNQ